MPQHPAVAWHDRLGSVWSIPFWMAQAPLFLVVFATLGLAVRGEWIAFAILVVCVWIYVRLLGHAFVMDQLEAVLSRVVVAVDRWIPKRPVAAEAQMTTGSDDEPPAPIVEAAPVEAAPPRRAPRRVRPLEVSPTKRLLALEELRETGLVTPAEYQDKRQEILRAI